MPVRLRGDLLAMLLGEAVQRRAKRDALVAKLAGEFGGGLTLARSEQRRLLLEVLPRVTGAGYALHEEEVAELAYPAAKFGDGRDSFRHAESSQASGRDAQRSKRLGGEALQELAAEFHASKIDADLVRRVTGYSAVTCRTYLVGLTKLLANRILVARVLSATLDDAARDEAIDKARSVLTNRRSRAVSQKLKPDRVFPMVVSVVDAIAEAGGPLPPPRRAALAKWAQDEFSLLERTAIKAIDQLAAELIINKDLTEQVRLAETSQRPPAALSARLMHIAGARHRPKTDRHPTSAEFARWYDQALNDIGGASSGSGRLNVASVYEIYLKSRERIDETPLQKSAFYESFKHWRNAQGGVLPSHGAADNIIVGYAPVQPAGARARLFLAVHEATGWIFAKWAVGKDLDGDSGQPTLEHWIGAHTDMLHEFGRVPAAIAHAPSSAALVIRYCRGRRVIGGLFYRQTYEAWAAHYGAAIPKKAPDRGPAKWPAIFLRAMETVKLVPAGDHAGLASAVKDANDECASRKGFMREDLVKVLPAERFAAGPWRKVTVRLDGLIVWNGDRYSVPDADPSNWLLRDSTEFKLSKMFFAREERTDTGRALAIYERIKSPKPVCMHKLSDVAIYGKRSTRTSILPDHQMSISQQYRVERQLTGRAEVLGVASLMAEALNVMRPIQIVGSGSLPTYRPLHYQEWNVTLGALNRASSRTQGSKIWRDSLDLTVRNLLNSDDARHRGWVASVHNQLLTCARVAKWPSSIVALDIGEATPA